MGQLFAAFGIDWHLLVIQAINFTLLLFALTYYLYKPILRIIDKRRTAIADGVTKAHEADKRLDDAMKEGKGMIGAAARKAEEFIASARIHAEERSNEILRAAEDRAANTLKDAAEHAEEVKRQALKQSEREIVRAAVLAAEKILRERSA